MSVDATKLELGPANVYLYIKPSAEFTTNFGMANQDVRFVAQVPGADGNNITITLVDPPGMNVALSVVVDDQDIVVTLATDGASAITTTAAQLVAFLNADPRVFFLIKTNADGDGTGLVEALVLTNLVGGSDTGVATDVGALGDDLQIVFATEANVLTAAQTGTFPQGKVISGGSIKIQVPFKEITLENLQRGIPNSVLVDDGNSRLQVQFRNRVGLNMRTLAVKMEIRKIIAGSESTLPSDIVIFTEVSPVDGEVTFPYSPTDQRVITANFEAWPDSAGVWGYFGDQII